MDVDLSKHIISDNHLINVCKYRQGSSCCRYIVYLNNIQNFCCAKKINDIKMTIDKKFVSMNARGDNCEGIKS